MAAVLMVGAVSVPREEPCPWSSPAVTSDPPPGGADTGPAGPIAGETAEGAGGMETGIAAEPAAAGPLTGETAPNGLDAPNGLGDPPRGLDEPGPDETGPDETGPDETGPDGAPKPPEGPLTGAAGGRKPPAPA